MATHSTGKRAPRRDDQGRVWVHRVEDGMDRQTIAGTNYQMRNFFRQLGDGFFSALDVFNYIQHHQIVRWTKPGMHVLDVCCGRGLLLPLLRYGQPKLGSYTGVDIAPENATFREKRVTDGKPLEPGYYPFPVRYVESNAATMAEKIGTHFGLIVYTSALEHMHPDLGLETLKQCRLLAEPGATLVLTTPRTQEGADGYQTQYRAHVYEWQRSELLDGLDAAGWELVMEYGLHIDRKVLAREMERLGCGPLLERIQQFVPPEWVGPVFAPAFPAQSDEIGFIARAR